MYSLNIKDLVNIPEGQFFDRKSARKEPEEIANHIIGFANAAGGFLAIGIEDEGSLTGFQIEGAFSADSYKNVIKNYCQSKVETKIYTINFSHENGKEDFILLFKVEPAYGKIIRNFENDIYLRLNDSTMKIPENKVSELIKEKDIVYFENLPEENASIKDLDTEILDEYKNILNSDSSYEEFLREKHFMVDGFLTKAAVILFAKRPSDLVPCARLRYLHYKDEADSDNPRTEENISMKEGLIKLLRNAKNILEPRMENAENSEFWFEDTLFMMANRDYSKPWEYPRIIIYNNSKLLYSPYSKPSYINLENVTYIKWPENKKITNTLIEFGWMKELNQGIKNLYSEKR
jgi:ATP-dependent DNA helicase RecG